MTSAMRQGLSTESDLPRLRSGHSLTENRCTSNDEQVLRIGGRNFEAGS
jgi:hypothetical protein